MNHGADTAGRATSEPKRGATVLILGGGAREHALAWKLRASPQVGRVLAAPGNPGIGRVAELVPLPAEDVPGILRFCEGNAVDLVVVGPEGPLTAGVVDALQERGLSVFGPSAAAARVEGSKAFAKELMNSSGIPTAPYQVMGPGDDAEGCALSWGPCVVKADGLAAGKGVIVADSGREAADAVRVLRQQLGEAASTLVIEDRLDGPEVSVIALCDGRGFALLPPARDHKRLLDADRGPNTGGMGAIATGALIDRQVLDEVGRRVIAPALEGLAARGTPFVGALYAGLMIGSRGLQVLEFNARFGDPECQVLMPLIGEDLFPWLMGAARGQLPAKAIQLRSGAAAGVVLAAEGYPAAPTRGDAIQGVDAAERMGGLVFHAGTGSRGEELVTAGGRVMTVCGLGDDLPSAVAAAYRAADAITFRGLQRRTDIGRKPAPSAPPPRDEER